MKNWLLIFLIPLTGCVSMGKTEQYIGINPKTKKGMFEVVTTHTKRGFFSPSVTSMQVWNCESVVTDSGLKYDECMPVGDRSVHAQNGMGSVVTTTAIAGTAAYFTAGALRPDKYNHSENNNLNNEGSQQSQKGYMKGGDSYSGAYNSNRSVNKNIIQNSKVRNGGG